MIVATHRQGVYWRQSFAASKGSHQCHFFCYAAVDPVERALQHRLERICSVRRRVAWMVHSDEHDIDCVLLTFVDGTDVVVMPCIAK